MDSKDNKGVSFDSQMIIKIVVGLAFIVAGVFLLVKNVTSKAYSTVDYSYKYDQATARLYKTVKNGDSYDAYYEYTYNDRSYKAISNKQFKNEGDAEKDVIIQVNRDNPEDYVFGEREEPKTNYSVIIIPGILVFFGLASIALSLKRII